jgi:hypothetical protein
VPAGHRDSPPELSPELLQDAAGRFGLLASNLLVPPAPQVGRPGPVTLTIGPSFAGVIRPAPNRPSRARHSGRASGRHQTSASDESLPGNGNTGISTVESRNGAANICSALPKANPDSGTPP